jgi:phosphatidylserine/phosphatidylglycerophosphate/cardiolipin synthase-like enzyme
VQIIIDARNARLGPEGALKPLLMQLQAATVEVRLGRGSSLEHKYRGAGRESAASRTRGRSGIMHAKTVSSESLAVVGSCNFTTSSSANYEVNVLIEWSERGARQSQAIFAEAWAEGEIP